MSHPPRVPAERPSPPHPDAEAGAADCRCLCGNLLARWVEDGVELKCRRCKRTLKVPLAQLSRDELRPVAAIPVGEAG